MSSYTFQSSSYRVHLLLDTGGTAGDSESGDATGGDGRGHGPGGNAYTGNTGQANGGAIINESGSIANTAAASKHLVFFYILRRMANSHILIDTAGDAGASDSGDAVGGDAVGDPDTTPVKRASEYATANGHAVNGHANGAVKRASDYATAGGNAYTGSTGNTGSGNIVNEAGEGGDDTSTLTNTGPSSELLFLFPVAAVLLLTAVLRRCRCRWRFYVW